MEMCTLKVYPNGAIIVLMPDGKDIPCQAGIEIKQLPKDIPIAEVTLKLIVKMEPVNADDTEK